MSSPFSKKFINKRSGLFMSKKQEKTFGPEGTNPNPEIYEAIKKNDSKTSSTPLEYSTAVATGYVSTRDSLQRMFDDIAEGTSKALEAVSDPQSQANRLERRIANRNKRADKKQKKSEELLGVTRTKVTDDDGNPVIDAKTGKQKVKTTTTDTEPTNKEKKKSKRLRDRAKNIRDKNINTLTPRYNKAKEKADSDMAKKLKQYEALYDLKNPKGTTYNQKMNQIAADYDERNGKGSFAKLGDTEEGKKQRDRIIAQRLQYTD
jgi:hypothetical protein